MFFNLDNANILVVWYISDAQISLLEKGLKFIPSRKKIDKLKLLSDLSQWERRMQLREYFYDRLEDNDHEEDPMERFKVRKTSNFTPGKGGDHHLDLYIELVKSDIIENFKSSGTLNITKAENDAFYELLNHPDIVIRPADKGSGIVVNDREQYLNELWEEI